MSKTAMITTRLEPELKADVESVLKELGMTTTQAITTFLTQVKIQRGLPFKIELPISKNVPNAETLAAFEEAETGQTESMSLKEFGKLCQ